MNNYQHKSHDPKVGRTRIIIWGALIGIIVLVVWAYFAQIDQVTRATATVRCSTTSTSTDISPALIVILSPTGIESVRRTVGIE